MVSQTSYYGKLVQPEIGGGRLKVIAGYVKFKSSASIATLPVPFKNRVVYVGLNSRTAAVKKCRVAWSSGAISGGAILVQRATGSTSAATYWYEVVGE